MKKRVFIDRKDAKRCDDLTSLNQILIDLKPKRSLAEVYINQEFDVSKLVKFYERLKKENEKITYFHLFMTLMAKLIYNRDKLNKFISNRHLYIHDNISISFIIKQELSDISEEIMQVIKIDDKDNIETISEKILEKVDSTRNNQILLKGANNGIKYFSKLPNFIRIPSIGIFKFLDKIGLMPNKFVVDNIYYSSMIVSNLGSIDCDSIYHNLTDFGTCSSLVTIGKVEEREVMGKSKYFCSFGVTVDERIADGYYLVKTMKLIEKILNNPEILIKSIDSKIGDDNE